MNPFHLTAEQKTILESRHAQARDSRESDRIKAILLKAEGWSIKMIAQALRKHRSSIQRHIEDYLREEKLKPDNGGSESYLTKHQTQELIAHIDEQVYQHTFQIVAYIKQRWSINYSVPGLNKWLHKNGFSYKKPKWLPHKADLTQQAAFIKTYTQLKEDAGSDEPIVFIDAVHPTQATKLSSGWIRKGHDKAVQTTGSRTRLNIIGAIRLGHLKEAVSAQYKTINAESIIDFMNQLRKQYDVDKRLHMILDGAGYHRAHVVKEHAKKLNIKLLFLPPYSPNLNPIERLWKVMNEQVRNNHYFKTAKEFREQMDSFFQTILPEIADSLNTRINDNFQLFDCASSS